MADGAGDVLLRQWNSLDQRTPEREVSGDGRGKAAAGAVRVGTRDALAAEVVEGVAVEEQVRDVIGGEVAAGNDHGRRAEGDDRPRGLAPACIARDRNA